jgi:hypothetical protein
MNALRLTLIASLLALGTAEAAGDESRVETIVVTARRPAFVESGETILVVTVRAPARVVPEPVIVAPEDDVVIEAPSAIVESIPLTLELPPLRLAPLRIMLALDGEAPRSGG